MGGELKRILITEQPKFDVLSDIKLIQKALMNKGFYATTAQINILWDRYSETLDYSWADLPSSDEEIVACIRPFFVPAE